MISSLAVQVLLWNLSDYDGGSLLNSEHGGGLAKTPILAASTKLQVSGGLCIGDYPNQHAAQQSSETVLQRCLTDSPFIKQSWNQQQE